MPLNTRETQTTNARRLAKLVRQLLSEEPYESLADLVDALKFRCARLRIRWTNDDLSDAIAMVESNRQLVPSKLPRGNPQHIERDDSPPGISRANAARLLEQIYCKTGQRLRLLSITPAASTTTTEKTEADYQAARERAWAMGVELAREEFF